jgi:hypothetical protein
MPEQPTALSQIECRCAHTTLSTHPYIMSDGVYKWDVDHISLLARPQPEQWH